MYFIRSKVTGDITLHSLQAILSPGVWVEIESLTGELKKLMANGSVEISQHVHPDSVAGKLAQLKAVPRPVVPIRPKVDRREQLPVRSIELPPEAKEVEENLFPKEEEVPQASAEEVVKEIRAETAKALSKIQNATTLRTLDTALPKVHEKPKVTAEKSPVVKTEGGRTVIGDSDEALWGVD